MAKVINLKPQEEITSVIERLWETGEEEVFLVLPKSSPLLKNIIALKLLKREAERLGKEVTLVTKEPLGREMAKRVGLASKAVLPKKALEEEDEEALGLEQESEQEVFRQVPEEKFESMLEDEVRARREAPASGRRFSDIRPKKALVESHSIEIEQKDEKITVPVEDLTDGGGESDDLIGGDQAERSDEEPGEEESFLEKIQKKYPAEEEPISEEEIEPEKEEDEEISEEPVENDEEEETEFPIRGLANGRRLMVKEEKKPFFSWRPNFNLKKINDVLKIEKVMPEKSGKRSAVPFFSGKFLGIFIGAAAVVLLATLYFVLPKAEISVKAKEETANQSLSVTADKASNKIDVVQNRIPAQLMKSDKRQSQEFATTGQRQVNDKAKGSITIYNEYSSSPQVLVEKTRFVSEGGQTFRLTRTTTVPGAKISEGKIVASSIEAEVVADQAGAEYNVGPGRFSIPGFQGTAKYAAFYGQSRAAMAGGASGVMKVVSQEDYDKAKDTIWKNLQPALDSEFKSQLPPAMKIIDGAMKLEMSGAETDIAVGSPAESFTMTLKGTAAAVLFDEQNVLELIKKKLADKLGDDKELALEAGQMNYQLSSVDYTRGQVAVKVAAAGKIIWKIDTDNLKKELAGQNENGIRKAISEHPEISEARVILWPFWVRSAPKDIDKVEIRVSR